MYTESGLVFATKDNRLRPPSSRATVVAPPFASQYVDSLLNTARGFLKEAKTRIEGFSPTTPGALFKLYSPTGGVRGHVMPWLSYSWRSSPVPLDTYLTRHRDRHYSLNNDYMSVPQIEALSSRRSDFVEQFLYRYRDWCPRLLTEAHPVFCFDTEVRWGGGG